MWDKLVVASHNKGKVAEIMALLAPFNVSVHSATEMNLIEPDETGASFLENAQIKSRAAAETSGLPSLADDSGLCVEALDNAPGIYSARWGGAEKDFNKAMQRVEEELRNKGIEPEGAAAFFVCMLSLSWPGKGDFHFEGIIKGTLTFPPRGKKGFGYDPIFVPDGESRTFAEMTADEKQLLSHRSRAFKKFELWLQERRAA